jgi:hypothetical protein
MTIDDIIANDLIEDIRTGSALDDSKDLIDFTGSILPTIEFSTCNRSMLGFEFEQPSANPNCAILEIGVWKDDFKSSTNIFWKSKHSSSFYFGVDSTDKTSLSNPAANIFVLQKDLSNLQDVIAFAASKDVNRFDFIMFDQEYSVNEMLEAWKITEYLAPGGTIAVHDVHYHPGPKKLVEALDPNKFDVKIVCTHKIMDYGLAFIKRK